MKRDKSTVIGRNIKELREERGLTVKELSTKTGLSASALSNYEYGFRVPNFNAMVTLERFFNVSGEYLTGETSAVDFFNNKEEIDSDIDLLLQEFMRFKSEFSIANQSVQKASTELVLAALKNTVIIMKNVGNSDADLLQTAQAINTFSCLSSAGKSEMLKRMQEYKIIDSALQNPPKK